MRLIVEVGDSQKIGNSGLVQFRHAPWLQVDTQLCERGRILEVERGKREREKKRDRHQWSYTTRGETEKRHGRYPAL